MPKSLDELAIDCGADKSTLCHAYTRAFETWLAPLRDRPVRLLEIGVGGGFSMRMWDRYFTHPEARIFGMEINPDFVVSAHPTVGERVRLVIGSQREYADLLGICGAAGMFDVVIDDGSHRWSDQQISWFYLWPHVKPGGQYWIEDLHTSYWQSHADGRQTSTIEHLKDLVDDVNMRGKPPEGPDCRANRATVLQFAATNAERTIAEIHFWKGLCLVKKEG